MMNSNDGGRKMPRRRPVTAGQIIARGLTLRCPNCGSRTLFKGIWTMHEHCSSCGLLFEREEGFFLGAMVFNYTLTAFVAVVVPCILLLAGLGTAPFREQVELFIAVLAAAALLPLVFYRPSKSLWMMTYYVFVPGDLPANQTQPS
jgi:uncharacterized protein (DUF983 family)